MNQEEVQISLVVPVMNEEDTVPTLAEEVTAAFGGSSFTWECIWVDDGSTDRTLEIIKDIRAKDDHHHFVVHDGNFGQSMALYSGFMRARGEILATIDGDGQNDPGDLPKLAEHLVAENADMVNGWRQNRHDSIVRKISSKIGNGFRNWITRQQIHDVGCSTRVFRRHLLKHLFYFKGMHRYLPTLVNLDGKAKILEKAVNHRNRQGGITKYGINNRLWVGIVDTLAIRWMQARVRYPEEKTTSFEG